VTPIGREHRAPGTTAQGRSGQSRSIPPDPHAESQSPAAEDLVYEIDANGILDPATVEAQRRITARCAKRGQRGTFLFRSDAPSARKLMMMWVDPLPGGGFRFTSRVLEPGELGERIHRRLMQVANQPMVARCDSCRRYRWLGSWLELDDCLVDPKTLRPRAIFRHTLCPDCRSTQHGLPLAVV
jgi:hypothetical protein